ncbi:class I SAM-dependent methyltransferase [Mucilaginibacter sp. OK098]|uniref:class I SAM-dependent methyltransferase n=1 Tax=Mucilaginibacter sp. OK098 TaxID=1855297 RepID=UPI00090EE9F2|nr:class I SAM-dependent methyltransferase [Mucilaginibacter sp. OK098]SHM74733.1 Methyltransferase domain-containing protein [Mucilaginibacter sp. OK098]
MKENKKAHWEKVYKTQSAQQVSWTQPIPQTSLDFIHAFNLPKNAKIIDIGGGDSKLVDYLLQEGFTNITVLDISAAALIKAKKRLGKKSKAVNWIISDIIDFQPEDHYDLWHDRATFHFLTQEKQIDQYLAIAHGAINNYMIISTFSENGPEKCSGLPVKQYSEMQLKNQLNKHFEKIRCINEDHLTPFHTTQSFLFCSFKKQQADS